MFSVGAAVPISRDDERDAHASRADAASSDADKERLERIVRDHFQLVWRTLRRLLPADAVDDAVQQVFVVASRKLDRIQPGSEPAFLLKAALFAAQHARRAHARRREVLDDAALEAERDAKPLPDESADRKRRLEILEAILDAMAPPLREVFVLFELEGLSSLEIAPLLAIPVGTVASRLRRAREEFHAHSKRLRAQGAAR